MRFHARAGAFLFIFLQKRLYGYTLFKKLQKIAIKFLQGFLAVFEGRDDLNPH